MRRCAISAWDNPRIMWDSTENLLDWMRRRRLTLALAESCTGGLIAARLTEVPGASDVLLGGIICYSNDSKIRILGVPEQMLRRHGAVSEEVAREMALRARALFAASCGLSVTGIAGPGGATPGKPVGLVFVAASAAPHAQEEERVVARRLLLGGSRSEVRNRSADAALALLEELFEHPPGG